MKISACYIVRNEAENLRKSMASVQESVDEFIVVDTGSTDKTIEVANAFLAKVYHQPWQDDFSAPRNYAIEHATGDFIVFIDADEYFSVKTQNNLRKIIQKYRTYDLLMVKRYDIDEKKHETQLVSWMPRIMRNRNGLRYIGRIHEELRNQGQPIAKIGLVPEQELLLWHTGYAGKLSKEKAQRNLRILNIELGETNNPERIWQYLAETYAGVQDYVQAEKYALMDIARGRQNYFYASRSWRVLILIYAGKIPNLNKRLDIARDAVKNFPELPEFHAELAVCLAAKKDYQGAIHEARLAIQTYGKIDSIVEPCQFDDSMLQQLKQLRKNWEQRLSGKDSRDNECTNIQHGYEALKAGNYTQAIIHLKKSLKESRDNIEALYGLSRAERELRHYKKAYSYIQAAIKIVIAGTFSSDFHCSVLVQYAEMARLFGDNEQAAMAYRDAARLADTLDKRCMLYSSYLLSLHGTNIEKDALDRAHLEYNSLFTGVLQYQHYRKDHARKKIRLGYISGDFRQHVMFRFYCILLAGYSRDKFEVFAYAINKQQDEYTDFIKKQVDKWIPLDGKNYEEMAACIYSDNVDILIDLGGHSAGSGLAALSWKPAPIQLSGLGYMSRTGLQQVDGFLTDEVLDPVKTGDDSYRTEMPLYLPSQFCYVASEGIPVSHGAPCKKSGYVTFGVFNNWHKINEELLIAWSEIMNRLPQSRLLLKAMLYEDEDAVRYCRSCMKKAGIDLKRVTFEPASDEYLSRYLDVDIALDTYPYTGGGTSCDALYMGVPVISLYGRRRGSRFGLSLLKAVGLAELAVPAYKQYVDTAVALASDAEILDALHKNLRTMMEKSPLMNSSMYIKQMEARYTEIWNGWNVKS